MIHFQQNFIVKVMMRLGILLLSYLNDFLSTLMPTGPVMFLNDDFTHLWQTVEPQLLPYKLVH